MLLKKPFIDFGLQANDEAAMQEFWTQSVGLGQPEILQVYEGVTQHRYALLGAVLKMNIMAAPLPTAPPTGYRKITWAQEGRHTTEHLCDPSGAQLTLAPENSLDGSLLELEVAVTNIDAFAKFYTKIPGLEQANKTRFAWGKSQIKLSHDPLAATTADDHGPGIRYITFQVGGLDGLHQRLIDQGVVEHMPPTQWNEHSYISFIRDPDNNLIELSQRADLQ